MHASVVPPVVESPASPPRLDRPALPPLAKPKLWWRVLSSFWLHFLIVVFIFCAYNGIIDRWQLELSNGRRGFSPEGSPLYMRLTSYEAGDYVRSSESTMPPVVKLAKWAMFDRDKSEQLIEARRAWPPIIAFVFWTALVMCQLLWLRTPGWLWAIVSVIFVLILNVTINTMPSGNDDLYQPFSRTEMEYYGDVFKVTTPHEFLKEYPELNRSHRITHHSGTHPPGGVLFLWWVARLWNDSVEAASLAAIFVSALCVIPVYFLASRLYGKNAGVIASALYAVTPVSVLFGATSMDGVFAFFPVFAIWLFYKAVKDRPIIYGVLFGLAMAMGLFMTFATLTIGMITTVTGFVAMIALLIESWRSLRRGRELMGVDADHLRELLRMVLRVILVNVIGLAVIVLFHLLMYWKWDYDVIDAVMASLERNAGVMGTGRETLDRYLDVSFACLFAFLIGVGAVATTLSVRQFGRAIADGLRRRNWDLLALSFLPALVLISFANLFTFEVERIWIFLVPFVIAAGAANIISPYNYRPRWLLLGAAMVLLFAQTWVTQLLFFTYW